MWLNNILETIGNTPLIELHRITSEIPATVLAKVDYFNPGHSIKDRMALKMVQMAEAEGKLKPGGTIIECTSGNTGMGLRLGRSIDPTTNGFSNTQFLYNNFGVNGGMQLFNAGRS